MGKLTAPQIDEYFTIHLPYRTRIPLAHYRMTREPWHGDRAQLEATFEASLVAGRMYLNILGIAKNRQDLLIPFRAQHDDVTARSRRHACRNRRSGAWGHCAFCRIPQDGRQRRRAPHYANAPSDRGHAYRHRADLRTDQSASLCFYGTRIRGLDNAAELTLGLNLIMCALTTGGECPGDGGDLPSLHRQQEAEPCDRQTHYALSVLEYKSETLHSDKPPSDFERASICLTVLISNVSPDISDVLAGPPQQPNDLRV
jgi:hypothetical protein